MAAWTGYTRTGSEKSGPQGGIPQRYSLVEEVAPASLVHFEWTIETKYIRVRVGRLGSCQRIASELPRKGRYWADRPIQGNPANPHGGFCRVLETPREPESLRARKGVLRQATLPHPEGVVCKETMRLTLTSAV